MKITYGMVGGDLKAFIGNIHRKAINFVDNVELVSGCFSNVEENNIETGQHFNLNENRIYKDYETMVKEESLRTNRPDFIVITTPNHLHYKIAKAFMLEGFNIVCEKPLCFTVEEAYELEKIAKEKEIIFAVMYSYTGYSMVKYAKQLIKDGKIGDIINVYAEYPQDWLISAINKDVEGPGLSLWRMNPAFSGVTNAVGDIGTHIEATVKYMTELKISRLLSQINRFGYELDLNANILVEYESGIKGSYWCSQVALGHPNGFKIRVYGTKGSLTWFQETPDYLMYSSIDGITSKLSRGAAYVNGNSVVLNPTPKGHPEGYIEAFANIYRTYIGTLRKLKNNETLDQYDLDFPSIMDGVEGVEFIHAVIDSDKLDSTWIELKRQQK